MAPCPSGLTTATSTTPAASVGTRPTIEVELTTTGGLDGGEPVGASGSRVSPPTVTLAGAAAFVAPPFVVANPVPVIVIWVPLGPDDGVTFVIVGCAAAVKVNDAGRVEVWLGPPGGSTIVTSTVP